MLMLQDETWFDLLEKVCQKIDALISVSGRHSMRVAHLARQIAVELGMQADELYWVW